MKRVTKLLKDRPNFWHNIFFNFISLKRKIFSGLNLKTAYTPNCVKSSGLRGTGIFVILLSQDGFESDRPESKFQTITS